jgi:zinc D-Ala-D-Ala carboxypeptidase
VTARRQPERVYRRRRILLVVGAVAVLAVVVTVAGVLVGRTTAGADRPSASVSPSSASASTAVSSVESSRPAPAVPQAPSPLPTPSFDKAARSIDDPSSIWVVANKSRALAPLGYAPPDLVFPDVVYVNHQPMRQEVATALTGMFAVGGQEAGLQFSVQSAYRSYETQVSVYDDDVAANGQAYADTDTARPGTSEHQTGLAVDISAVPASCSLDACFGTTPQGQWLAANAWRFGFLLRYPADKVAVTGYTYEPWHFRYIGVDLATQLHETGITTLEEFFGVPGGTVYP